jgi:hypothetical protein
LYLLCREVNFLDVITLIVDVAKGAGAGAVAAVVGYLKKPKDEEFDSAKFTKTVVVGGVVGGLAAGLNVPVESAEAYVAYPLAVYGVDAVVKAVNRKVVAPAVGWLKSKL